MVHVELEVECLKATYFLTTTNAGKIHTACEVISDSIHEALHFGQEDRMVDKFVGILQTLCREKCHCMHAERYTKRQN